MQGVVVDFWTLYDPVALTATVLSYLPKYKAIYVSKHSFWLEASPARGSGWVPIDGFRQFEQGLDHPGIEWVRNWCRNNLKTREDAIVKGNLYASILLIQKLRDIDLLRLIPFEETFTKFSEKILTPRATATALTFDSMIPYGESTEDGFYLSPDRGHGLELGTALVMTAKNDFRFSTNNHLIEAEMDEVLAKQAVPPRRHRETEFTVDLRFGPGFAVDDVLELIQNRRLPKESENFTQQIEGSEKDLLYFATHVSLDKSSGNATIRGKIIAHVWERLGYSEAEE